MQLVARFCLVRASQIVLRESLDRLRRFDGCHRGWKVGGLVVSLDTGVAY
jgi:hypothetical protein